MNTATKGAKYRKTDCDQREARAQGEGESSLDWVLGKTFRGGDNLGSEWRGASLRKSFLSRVKVKWRGHNSGLSLGYQGQESGPAWLKEGGRGMNFIPSVMENYCVCFGQNFLRQPNYLNYTLKDQSGHWAGNGAWRRKCWSRIPVTKRRSLEQGGEAVSREKWVDSRNVP